MVDLRKYNKENGYTKTDYNESEILTLTTEQMAKKLQISTNTVRNIIREKNIPTLPCTKNILVLKKDFYAAFGFQN